MTSLLCVKSQSGKVTVHNEEMKEQLMVDDKASTSTSDTALITRPPSKKVSVEKRPLSTPSSHLTLNCGSVTNDMSQNPWLSKKQLKELQDQSFLKDFDDCRWICNSLLETEKTFVKDIGDYLDHKDMLDRRKKELLHKKWNLQVYEPIRQKVIEAMESESWTNKDRRRRELHHQYLEHVNKKGHVFLDTLDAGEYYAQALNHSRPAPISVQTGSLRDPLLAQERERSREDQVLLRCMTGHQYSRSDIDQMRLPPLPLVPQGRHGIDSVGWLEMPLGNIESTPRKASRLRMRGNCTDTQIDFREWSKLQFDAKLLDLEMQLQKKRMFEEKPPYGIPARQFDRAPFAAKTSCSEQNTLCAVTG